MTDYETRLYNWVQSQHFNVRIDLLKQIGAAQRGKAIDTMKSLYQSGIWADQMIDITFASDFTYFFKTRMYETRRR